METINPPVEDILVFHQVALLGSFSQAALELGFSKSQVTKRIQRLESYLSTQLFVRSTRQISITESGKELLKASHKILDLTQLARVSIKGLSQGEMGRMRFTAPSHFGTFIFGLLVPVLEEKFGKLDLDIDLTNEHRDLARDDFDFAVRASAKIHPDLIAKSMGKMKDVICISPKLLGHAKTHNITPENVTRFPIIVNASPEWNEWRLYPKHGDEVNLPVTGKIKVNNYGLIRELCLRGVGIARIPLYLVDEDLRSKRLIPLLEAFSISTHPLYLVYKRSPYYSSKHKRVRDLLLNWFIENRRFFSHV